MFAMRDGGPTPVRDATRRGVDLAQKTINGAVPRPGFVGMSLGIGGSERERPKRELAAN